MTFLRLTTAHLGLSHDDVDAVISSLDQLKTFVSQGEPAISLSLDITAQCHPVISLAWTQQSSNIVPVCVVVILDFSKSKS